LTVSFPGMKYLISEGIGLKNKKKRTNNDRFCQEIFHRIAKTN
jgi:hypothetical protein